MSTDTKQDRVLTPREQSPQQAYQNGRARHEVPSDKIVAPPPDRADLPTFPLEVGWRESWDADAGVMCRAPLTLLDILYPTEDDVGAVRMSQSLPHDIWCTLLTTMLRVYLGVHDWLITHDVLIHWNRGSATPKSPDLAAMLHGTPPPEGQNSYRVGRDGPIPAFVAEVTSKDTRWEDLDTKPLIYAAVGVKEYLIIDIQMPASEDWRLIGYRLYDNNPLYQRLTPDTEGGLTFETINMRFVAVERSRIDVYDATTGKRLLTPDEQIARAEAAERERAAMAAELAQLKTQLKPPSADGPQEA